MAISDNKITERMIRLMQADNSVDAPPDSIKWAKNVFRSRAAEPKVSMVRKVMAVLQMDISPQKAAFGERSGSTAGARQMLFDAGENSIDLRIKETEGGLEIHGQILGEGFAGALIELSNNNKGDKRAYKTQVTETSEFKLAGVALGSYSFAVEKGGTELLIEGLDLN